MPRFVTQKRKSNKTKNYEGDSAYKLTSRLQLYTAVCTASLQPKFYVPSVESEEDRIRSLIRKVPHEFTAKLAVYAREKMYLRSIPLVLAVELAKVCNHSNLVSRVVERVIQRADELYEILGYYQQANNTEELKKLSKQIQKGVARAFLKFDEYQFAKYNRKTVPSLRDALFLSHAKPQTKEQEELFKKIADNNLTIPYTWEVLLSKKGNTKKVWEELIASGQVGYMALLRNLRNIINAKVSAASLEKVLNHIKDPANVRKSKQLPFRFLAAYREIKNLAGFSQRAVLEALEDAIKASCDNIPIDASKVVIACDVSGSMQIPISISISARSKIQYYDIGLMLGMMLNLKCEKTIVGMFGDDWKVIPVPRDNILKNADELHRREGEVGYATNGYKVIKYLLNEELPADKVMVFTDMQLWNTSGSSNRFRKYWQDYKKFAPEARLYLFDLGGYGNTPISVLRDDVTLLAGWSDKIFDILAAVERGEDALTEIDQIEI